MIHLLFSANRWEFKEEMIKKLEEVLQSTYQAKIFMETANRIFGTFLKNEGITDLFEGTDLHGRLNTLINFDVITSKEAVTLQHPSITNKMIYGVTQKHFINLLADELNTSPDKVEALLQSPNLVSSVWLNDIKNGAQMEM